LFVSTLAFAAPDLCSAVSSVTDAAIKLEIKDRRTQFVEGEIIPLVMSFTSSAAKRYWADVRSYDRSGRLDIETYCLEPAAPDPAADYFRSSGGWLGGGLGSTQELSEKPFTANAELNEWRTPAPGHYRLYVVSHRVWRPPDPGEPTPYGRIAITLRSNVVEFDVVKSDPEWRAQQLQEALTAYRSENADQKKDAARRLRFLNTKESADVLASLFSGFEQPGGWDLMFGLFASPYRTEVIAAMKRDLTDPAHPITQEFLHILTNLEIAADPAWNVPTYDPAQPKVAQDYWRNRQAHQRELTQAAIAVVASALPQKTGQAHALTVQTLAQSSDLLKPATAAQMRAQLVSVWHDLPENTKEQLIQYRWPMIAGPEMLPVLKDFVSRPAPPFRTMEGMARDAALKHIYEMDPAEGRALILRDLREAKAQPSLSLVELIPAEQLKPIVQDALDRITKSEARELDFHLLELYGDSSTLPVMKHVFNERVGKWACDPQDAMLRYFLKLDPDFGIEAVRQSLGARKETGCYRMLLTDLEKSFPKVEPLAIASLDDADLELATNAAQALGRLGTPKAEPALWARLKRFHEQWASREDELRYTPDFNSDVARATTLESNLISAIATGTSWICGPDKLDRLSRLASLRQKMQIESWNKQWQSGETAINSIWSPEDHPTFGVLQYSNLDEEQFRAKLSQMPAGMILYFHLWKPGQISPPVTMERQRAVLQSLQRAAAAGVTIQEKSDP